MTTMETPGGDLVEVTVVGVVQPDEDRHFVNLKEKGGDRSLPVFIGPSEAAAIAFTLQGQTTRRPMTHDALKQAIDALGVEWPRWYWATYRRGQPSPPTSLWSSPTAPSAISTGGSLTQSPLP